MSLIDYIRRKKFNKALRQKLLDEQQRRALADEEESRKKQQTIIHIGDTADYEAKKKDKQLKRKYILGQIAQMTLTILCVIGISALSFFFVHQFGLDYGIPKLITYIVGAGIAGIIFTGYFSLFTVSAFKANKAAYEKQLREKVEEVQEHRLSKEEQEKHERKLLAEEEKIIKESKFLMWMRKRTLQMKKDARIRIRFENYLKREAKKSIEGTRKTKLQMMMMTVTMAICTLAISFLGGGNYLGIMDIGATSGLAVAFQPLAILSGLAMFVTFIGYFHADIRKNSAEFGTAIRKAYDWIKNKLAKLFRRTKNIAEPTVDSNQKAAQKKDAEQKQEDKKQEKKKYSFMAWVIRIGYYFLAVFSAVGFASFKFYSTSHVAEIMGFTSPAVIGLAGGAAFVSMMIFSLTTNTVSMWKVGTIQSEKYDIHRELKRVRKIAGIKPPASSKRPFLFYVAWAVTFLTAAFNGVGSFIGMYSVAVVYPPLLIPLIIVGALAAIARFAEIMIYYGPVIVENMSGVKVELDAHKKIEKHQAEIDLIKSQHPDKFPLEKEHDKNAKVAAGKDVVSVNDPQHDFAPDANSYSDPTGALNPRLGRRLSMKLDKQHEAKLDHTARTLEMG